MKESTAWISVLDTETTGGTEPGTNQICEIALVTLAVQRSRRVANVPIVREEDRFHALIKPSCPVFPIGRACHHISDRELAPAPPMQQFLGERKGLLNLAPPDGDTVAVAAHNLAFDVERCLESGVQEKDIPQRRICTWKCARVIYPDAPAHSNQVLRYYLGLKISNIPGMPPHRALPDAVVTAGILTHMLRTSGHSVDDLIRITAEPILLDKCPFGKHAGTPWSEVPRSYLHWILDKGPRRPDPSDSSRSVGFDEDVMHTVRHYLGATP